MCCHVHFFTHLLRSICLWYALSRPRPLSSLQPTALALTNDQKVFNNACEKWKASHHPPQRWFPLWIGCVTVSWACMQTDAVAEVLCATLSSSSSNNSTICCNLRLCSHRFSSKAHLCHKKEIWVSLSALLNPIIFVLTPSFTVQITPSQQITDSNSQWPHPPSQLCNFHHSCLPQEATHQCLPLCKIVLHWAHKFPHKCLHSCHRCPFLLASQSIISCSRIREYQIPSVQQLSIWYGTCSTVSTHWFINKHFQFHHH